MLSSIPRPSVMLFPNDVTAARSCLLTPMASIDSASTTFGSLRDAPFLSEEQRREIDALPNSIRASFAALSQELIRRGLFTAFQIEEIGAGRGDRLLVG